MASKFIGALTTIGETTGSLDNIETSVINELDAGFVMENAAGNVAEASFYTVDSDVGGAEVSPLIITPKSEVGNKRWILAGLHGRGIKSYGDDATDITELSSTGSVLTLDYQEDGGTMLLQGTNTTSKSMILMNPAGAVTLYHAGSAKLATSATGATLTGRLFADGLTIGDAESIEIGAGLDGLIYSDGNYLLIGHGGGGEVMAKLIPNGAVSLYYDNLLVAETSALGLRTYDTDGDDPRLDFHSSAGVLQGYTQFSNGGSFHVYSSLGAETMIYGTVNADVSLYYAGVPKLTTRTDGIQVQYTATADEFVAIKGGSGYGQIQMGDPGAYMELRARNVGDTASNLLFKADPDGAAELYHNGVQAFETTAAGVKTSAGMGIIAISGAAAGSEGGELQLYGAPTYDIISIDNSGGILRMFNATTGNLMITCNPIGPTTLYYNNIATVQTDASAFRPMTDSTFTCGSSGYCWSNVYADAGITACSDPKYKKNVQQETLGLEFINDLVPIAFKFKKTGKRPKNHERTYHGLMATDVEAALQAQGLAYEDFAGIEENYDDDGERWLGLKYEQMIAPMLKAIQELYDKVKQLERIE